MRMPKYELGEVVLLKNSNDRLFQATIIGALYETAGWMYKVEYVDMENHNNATVKTTKDVEEEYVIKSVIYYNENEEGLPYLFGEPETIE